MCVPCSKKSSALTALLSSRRGSQMWLDPTQGLRPGLYSGAFAHLEVQELLTAEAAKVAQRSQRKASLRKNYSGPTAPSASDSNLVELFRNASFTVPVGPLRCLRIISSATPSSSGSSGL